MRRRTMLITAASLAAAFCVALATPAQGFPAQGGPESSKVRGFAADNSKRLDELKQNFKTRFADVAKAKSAGHIGETMQGVLDVVDPAAGVPASVGDLVSAENADRRELYRILADQEGTTPDVVAKRNALRNYENARSGDYLKKPDGTWGRKK